MLKLTQASQSINTLGCKATLAETGEDSNIVDVILVGAWCYLSKCFRACSPSKI